MRRYETATAVIKRWKVGGLIVAELKSRYGLSTRSLVIEPRDSGEVIRSRHRKRSAAMRAAKRGTAKPRR
jgi:hypothetical protein